MQSIWSKSLNTSKRFSDSKAFQCGNPEDSLSNPYTITWLKYVENSIWWIATKNQKSFKWDSKSELFKWDMTPALWRSMRAWVINKSLTQSSKNHSKTKFEKSELLSGFSELSWVSDLINHSLWAPKIAQRQNLKSQSFWVIFLRLAEWLMDRRTDKSFDGLR